MKFLYRSHLYAHLEEQFGLEPGVLPPEEMEELDPGGGGEGNGDSLGKDWRDLIPVIKVKITLKNFIEY